MFKGIEIADTADDHYWCKESPNVQRAWSPSSLDTLQSCARKYYYKYVLGIEGDFEKPAPVFGRYFHDCAGRYRAALLRGEPEDQAVDEAVSHALELGHGWEGDKTRNKFTLTRALIWYFEHYKNDDMKILELADGRPAIEVSFKIALPLISPDGEPYLLSGFIDGLVHTFGMNTVQEMKTTGYTLGDRYYEFFKNSNQVSAYTMAGHVFFGDQIQGLMIDAVQTAVTMTEFGRHFEKRSPARLEEWIQTTVWWIKQAERYVDEDNWPMNLSACNHYGGCPFRNDVCSQTPKMRTMEEFEIKRRTVIDHRLELD